MNQQRRNELNDVVEILGEARDRLDEIRCDEQDCFDNLPEPLQCSRTGDAIEASIALLDQVDDDISQVVYKIQKIQKK